MYHGITIRRVLIKKSKHHMDEVGFCFEVFCIMLFSSDMKLDRTSDMFCNLRSVL